MTKYRQGDEKFILIKYFRTQKFVLLNPAGRLFCGKLIFRIPNDKDRWVLTFYFIEGKDGKHEIEDTVCKISDEEQYPII